MKIERILVPVDFSANSLAALDYAIDFAKPHKAELVVLFVIEPIYYAAPTDMYAPGANFAILIEEQRRSGLQQLAKLERRLRSRRVKARTRLQTGNAAQTIVDEAKRNKVGLIVMATHGRTGLSHVFMGSVAERVVRTAVCPVLTIHVQARRSGGSKRKRTSR